MIGVDQPHQWSQRRKAPAIIFIATTRWQRWQCNNHFLSYCKEWWQYPTNAREEQKNSHPTIKLSWCHLQDATTTILCHAVSSASTPKLSTVVSTPKTACKYAKDGVYIAKGKYGECTKEATFIKEDNDEPLATRAIGSIRCARQQ